MEHLLLPEDLVEKPCARTLSSSSRCSTVQLGLRRSWFFLQQEHADTLAHLRLMLSFADAVLGMVTQRGGGAELYGPQDSVVVDQVGQLSKQWG